MGSDDDDEGTKGHKRGRPLWSFVKNASLAVTCLLFLVCLILVLDAYKFVSVRVSASLASPTLDVARPVATPRASSGAGRPRPTFELTLHWVVWHVIFVAGTRTPKQVKIFATNWLAGPGAVSEIRPGMFMKDDVTPVIVLVNIKAVAARRNLSSRERLASKAR